MKLRIKKGDTVKVLVGKSEAEGGDRGKTGRVIEVYKDTMRVLVEGVNIHKKHARKSAEYPEGGIIEKEFPVHYSNLMVVDSDGTATRVGIERKVLPNGDVQVTRVARSSRSNKKEIK